MSRPTLKEAMRLAARGDGWAADFVNAEVRRLHFALGNACPSCGWDEPQCECPRSPCASDPGGTR